jgi:hypothetical protein
MKLAHAQEVKSDYRAALDTYTKLKNDYPATSEGQQADKYIARAEAKLN